MNTPIHQHVIDRLLAARGTWPAVAAASGVPRRTLEKIARQEIENPGIKHVEALIRYFEQVDREAA